MTKATFLQKFPTASYQGSTQTFFVEPSDLDAATKFVSKKFKNGRKILISMAFNVSAK
jgi:hypothetical protein